MKNLPAKMNRLVCQTFLSFICFTLGQQTTEVRIVAFLIVTTNLLFFFFFSKQHLLSYLQNPSPIGTGLIPDQNDALLMFSTLDGSLVAVEQKTGDIRWHQNDGNCLILLKNK